MFAAPASPKIKDNSLLPSLGLQLRYSYPHQFIVVVSILYLLHISSVNLHTPVSNSNSTPNSLGETSAPLLDDFLGFSQNDTNIPNGYIHDTGSVRSLPLTSFARFIIIFGASADPTFISFTVTTSIPYTATYGSL